MRPKSKSGDEFKEVFKKLKKIEIVSDDNIHVLGVNLTFTRNYELLESFAGIDVGNRERLFFSLLNSRIITATLRAILSLKRLQFPEDLSRIEFNYPDSKLFYKRIEVPCNGQLLYDWASGIERSIYELLDSFLPMTQTSIEQFLSFSAPLYERMLSLNLNMINVSITAMDQDKEIRRIANEKWRELQKMIPESLLIMRFLENLCSFCFAETFRVTAPYAPGVSGFYIDASRTIRLINEEDWLSNELFKDLQLVLNTCLAFNLLHVKETMQGKKGQKKNVYYLNRWLCVKFSLPLNYGGWRTKKPDDLLRWTRR